VHTSIISAPVGAQTTGESFLRQATASRKHAYEQLSVRLPSRHPLHGALHPTASTVRSTNPRQKTSITCPARHLIVCLTIFDVQVGEVACILFRTPDMTSAFGMMHGAKVHGQVAGPVPAGATYTQPVSRISSQPRSAE